MNGRIAAIVRADVLTRFRRLSTVVVFLLLSATAYLWVPDPASGKTIMAIGGARVLYNSAALGLSTATLATIFVGLFGFYVVSNAVQRDVTSRCGFVIAATDMRTSEYLFGKFMGNVVFLATFMGGYMLAAMAMLLVRGEAPLQPLVFARPYLAVVPSTIVFVSVIAILFESIPWLSGRFGDVVYFFLWASVLGVVVNAMEHGAQWARFIDFNGFGFLFNWTKETFHTQAMSIGQSSFDRSKALIITPDLTLTMGGLLARLTSTVAPLPLLGIALVFFHRFDPARVRTAGPKGKRSWSARLNMLAKPLVRPLVSIAMRGGSSPSLLRAAMSDALITISSYPVFALFFVFVAIGAFAGADILSIGFLFAGIFIADVASRDRRAGTLGFVWSSPLLQPRFVLWKLMSSTIVAATMLTPCLVRAAITRPVALPALIVACLFVAAMATGLGVISGNPKTFIVTYLTLWYIAVNDKGANDWTDFAGFFHLPSPTVMAGYAVAGLLFLAAGEALHRRRLEP